jgi:hypothetical protein
MQEIGLLTSPRLWSTPFNQQRPPVLAILYFYAIFTPFPSSELYGFYVQGADCYRASPRRPGPGRYMLVDIVSASLPPQIALVYLKKEGIP